MPDQVWGTTMKNEAGEADPDHSPTTDDITIWVIVIHIEATLDHNTGIDASTTEVVHNDLVQPLEADLPMTHCTGHTADPPNITALQVTNPKITVGHTHDHPNNL